MVAQIDLKGLGSRIRKRRKQLGLTQAALAEMTDVTTNYIGHIERAERVLSLQTLLSLCYALEVNVNTLLQDSLPDDGFDENPRYYLRQARCLFGNTLTNWVCTDIPDIAGESDAPVDLALLPPMGFMTLEECAAAQALN